MGVKDALASGPAGGEAVGTSAGFDFLHGRWDVLHTKLRQRLAGCSEWFDFAGTLDVSPILGGQGNFDHNVLFDPAGTYEAHSLRLYSPAEGIWSVWWLDAQNPGAGLGRPVTGRFEGRKVTLFGDDVFYDRPIQVRTTYESWDHFNAQWTQSFQETDGSWEVNWIMDFSRIRE